MKATGKNIKKHLILIVLGIVFCGIGVLNIKYVHDAFGIIATLFGLAIIAGGIGCFYLAFSSFKRDIKHKGELEYKGFYSKDCALQIYQICKENNILKISNEYERAKAIKLIENDHFIKANVPDFEKRIEELFNKGFEENETLERKKAIKEDERVEATLLKKKEEMNRYISFYGIDKKKQMLLDLIDSEEKKLKEIKGSNKELEDNALKVAPEGPAYMFTNAYLKNQQAKFEAVDMAKGVGRMRIQKQRDVINQIKLDVAELSKKVVLDIDKETAFTYLCFENTDIQTDASQKVIYVSTDVRLGKDLCIHDVRNWVVDGCVDALIYSNGEEIGVATLTLPYDGIGARNNITGMCLLNNNANGNYTVKFVPKNLWIMEK